MQGKHHMRNTGEHEGEDAMRLSVKEITAICSAMKDNGVVLYGAGKRGKDAVRILEKEEFI